jgi:hypothetical protein
MGNYLKRRIIVGVPIMAFIGIAVLSVSINATERKAKAAASYCMTCGCKNPVSLDDKPFTVALPGTVDATQPGYNGGTCYTIKTDSSQQAADEARYAELDLLYSVVAQMKGNYCRLSGYYKTTAGRFLDMYADYRLTDQTVYPFKLGYIYLTGVDTNNGANGWQKFEYFFDFKDIAKLDAVRFFVRSPDLLTEVNIDSITICTYYRDEFRAIALLSDLAVSSGTLNPEFLPYTTSYWTGDVSETAIQVTPYSKNPNSTIKINNTPVDSGSAYEVSLTPGFNLITIDVSVPDGISMRYVIDVNQGTNGDLNSLVLASPGKMDSLTVPVVRGTYDYSIHVANAVTSITAALKAFEPTSAITVNNTTVASGTYGPMALNVGVNQMIITVTPPAGINYKRTYRLIVNRAIDVSLKSLSIADESSNPIPYQPAFVSTNDFYEANVADPAVQKVNIASTPSDPDATVVYWKDKLAVADPIDIPYGRTDVKAEVISSDNEHSGFYTIAFYKCSDAALPSLGFSAGTVGKYDSHRYYVNVDENVNEISVIPTAQDNGATICIVSPTGSQTVASGTSSSPIGLRVGDNTSITVVVTARDGVTQETYTAEVFRAGQAGTPMVALTASTGSGWESSASPVIQVTISPAPTSNVTVDYSVTGGSAVSGTDYTLPSGQLTFDASDTIQYFPLTIIDNAVPNPDKTVIITLSNPNPSASADLGFPYQYTYTIKDDELKIHFLKDTASGEEQNRLSDNPLIVTAVIDPAPSSQVTVDFTLAGTAQPGVGKDYALANLTQTLTFGPTTVSQDINILLYDNNVHQSNRAIIITLNPTSISPANGAFLVSPSEFTYTIIDNDQAVPTVYIPLDPCDGSHFNASASPTIDIPVQIDNPPATGSVSVPFTLTGTAVQDVDYTLSTTSPLTFDAATNWQNKHILIPINNTAEDNKTIIVSLSQPTGGGAQLGNCQTLTDIIDNSRTFAFQTASGNGTESVTDVYIPVLLSSSSNTAVSVGYQVNTSSTAQAGTDYYTLGPGTLNFPALNTSQNIHLQVINNRLLARPNVTVIIDLVANIGQPSLGTPSTFTYTINSNEKVIAPASGDVWTAGLLNTVHWLLADAGAVDLICYVFDGYLKPSITLDNVNNTGTCDVIAPYPNENARIQISEHGNTSHQVLSGWFKIKSNFVLKYGMDLLNY